MRRIWFFTIALSISIATPAAAGFNCTTTTSGGSCCCGTASNGLSGCCWFEGDNSTCVWSNTASPAVRPADLEYTATERFRASLDADRSYDLTTGKRPRLRDRWYVTAGTAYSMPSDIDGAISFDGVPRTASSSGRSGRLNEVAVGRYFNRTRVEVSVGDIAIRYGDLSTEFGVLGVTSEARISLVTTRLQYDIRRSGPIQPYIGIGLGYYAASLRWADRALRSRVERSSGIAHEVEAGITLPVSQRTSVVPVIRYVATQANGDEFRSDSMLSLGLKVRLTF